MIGIIGGTGFYAPELLEDVEELEIDTPYGRCKVYTGSLAGRGTVFLPRHGEGHSIPPHRISYRRNITAVKLAGAERLISLNSVGSLHTNIAPGSVLVPHDFIDLTEGREQTFFDDKAVHIDMTEPYCSELRRALLKAAATVYKEVHEEGVYVCTQGPRLETPAEIRMLRLLGGDVVGMVGVPEVTLAREAGLCYASICTIVNYGSGITSSALTMEELKRMALENAPRMWSAVKEAVRLLPAKRGCGCAEHVSEAGI